jgi:hypothetical protein
VTKKKKVFKMVVLDLFVDGLHVHGMVNDLVVVGVILLARPLHEDADQLNAVVVAIPAHKVIFRRCSITCMQSYLFDNVAIPLNRVTFLIMLRYLYTKLPL